MKVDVILPLHNGRRWAAEAIESVRAQTHSEWRLFIVDDASTDDYLSELRAIYEKQDDRITYWRTRSQAGPGQARMLGLSHGTAEAIAFIDQDDRWSGDKLERQCRRLAGEPRVEAVFSDLSHMDEDGRPLPRRESRKSRMRSRLDFDGLSQQELKRLLFFRHDIVPLVSAMVARQAFQRIGGFDSRLQGGQDNDFWIRFADAGFRLAHLPRELVERRIHPGNTSRAIQWRQGQWAALDKIVAEHDDLRPFLGKRRRNLICEGAMNRLESGDIRGCRSEAGRMLRLAPWDYRAYALLVYSLIPGRGAAWVRSHLR